MEKLSSQLWVFITGPREQHGSFPPSKKSDKLKLMLNSRHVLDYLLVCQDIWFNRPSPFYHDGNDCTHWKNEAPSAPLNINGFTKGCSNWLRTIFNDFSFTFIAFVMESMQWSVKNRLGKPIFGCIVYKHDEFFMSSRVQLPQKTWAIFHASFCAQNSTLPLVYIVSEDVNAASNRPKAIQGASTLRRPRAAVLLMQMSSWRMRP